MMASSLTGVVFPGQTQMGNGVETQNNPQAVIFLFQCEVAPTGSCAECLVLGVLFWGLLEPLRGWLHWTESEGIGFESSRLLPPICLHHTLLLS